jgi:hypothetical protein
VERARLRWDGGRGEDNALKIKRVKKTCPSMPLTAMIKRASKYWTGFDSNTSRTWLCQSARRARLPQDPFLMRLFRANLIISTFNVSDNGLKR